MIRKLNWNGIYSDWTYTCAAVLAAFAGHVFKYFDVYYYGDNKYRHFFVPMVLDILIFIVATQTGGRLAQRLGKRIDGWLAALISAIVYSFLAAPAFLYYRYHFTPLECYAIFMMPAPCAKPTYENIVLNIENYLTLIVPLFLIGTTLYLLLKFSFQKLLMRIGLQNKKV